MRSNEKDTNTAYERAVKRDDLSPTLRATLERNWEDEQRHRKWIEDQLAAMGSVDPEVNLPDDTGIASEEYIGPR